MTFARRRLLVVLVLLFGLWAATGGRVSAQQASCFALPERIQLRLEVGEPVAAENATNGPCTVTVSIARPVGVSGDTVTYTSPDGATVTEALPESPDRSKALQAIETAEATSCEVNVLAAADRAGVTATVESATDSGAACEGFHIAVLTELPEFSAPQPGSLAMMMWSSKEARGQVVTRDIINIIMTITREDLLWSYDGSFVTGGSPEIHGAIYDEWWYPIFGAWNLTLTSHSGGPAYRAYLQRQFYSDGFPNSSYPDTSGTSNVNVYGLRTGGFICNNSQTWWQAYPGFHWESGCFTV